MSKNPSSTGIPRNGRTAQAQRRLPLSTALAATGSATLITQVLLLRELMTAWRGNEMSFGIAMAVWLLSGGAGSAAYGLIARRFTPSRSVLARALIALGALAPAALFTSRALRGAMGLTTGEVSGLAPLVLASIISLSPFTIIAGLTFALSTSVVHRESGSRAAAGRVYLTEAAGAAVAGLVVSLVLLPRLDPVSIALTATLLLCAVSVWLLLSERRDGHGYPAGALAIAVALGVASVALIGPAGHRLDNVSVGAQWSDVGFVSQTNSIYGRIIATGMGSQKSIYQSGVLAASVPDRRTAEETVHLAMLAHPAPSRVLMLGGGLGGAVGEVLKHPSVTAVDYVELDPELVRTARQAFGSAMMQDLDDPRVVVHFEDARFFVKRTVDLYDVVIVGAPDPTTAQLNRFYTVEFFSEVALALADGGVVGFSVQSAENYISAGLAEFLACLKSTTGSIFPAVALYPGDPCHILASSSATTFTRDAHVLNERVRERGLEVAYVREYYLADRLSAVRVEQLDAALRDAPARMNTDLSPAAYYQSLVLWNRQFSESPGILLAAPRYVNDRSALLAAAVLVVVLVGPALSRARRGRSQRRAIVAAVFVVGATEISLELAALLAFQSIYGYVYQKLALIVAAFMGGLALGGWLGSKAASRGADAGSFATLQLCIAAVPLALGAALARVASLPQGDLQTAASFFPAIVVGAALLAGVQFPLAAKLLSDGRSDTGSAGGRLYAADLAGAAVGAVGAAIFLLPVMGTLGAMRALSILNLAVFVSLLPGALASRRR